MLLVDIVQKFISAEIAPSKYTIQGVLGFSAQTLVRRGFKMQDLKILYREMTNKTKLCNCCSIPIFNSVNVYCSHSCSANANNRKRSIAKQKNLQPKRCMNCDTVLVNVNSKYCSHKCQQQYAQNTFIKDWLSGEKVETEKVQNVSKRIRTYLFDKHNNCCAKCGWGEVSEFTGKTPLEIEHIDGNSSNNSPENLTLLCPNCHSLTPTYRALNKGSGRYNRMKRYKEGKSY